MKISYVYYVQLFAWFAYCDEEHYPTKYDSIDFMEVLENDRLIILYLQCILSEGPCPPLGRLMKEILPEAVATNCRKCSSIQKRLIRMSSVVLRERFPEYWEKLSDKFDPDRIYLKSFLAFLDSDD
ncbi:hypothetical protein PPYR_01888 [Photinus pyralis]|uniref:Uncharacterized protein n=1 Tax=Photinus pyralis TaxID=7054 RepID=A0A1Y1N074_PHOPY|nr:ejaculatory bulb-specific protein 3-like [Photinus pyralis]KAB0804918.1 hypothetical protein PPYR_01888 [Photinus pyralis]